jgi:hypothetical protein
MRENLLNAAFVVDVIEAFEIGEERLVAEEGEVGFLERAFGGVALVGGEDVGEFDFFFEAELDVEAEEETALAELHHVARHAVVRGRDAVGLEQLRFDGAEDLLPARVEPRHPLAQRGAVRLQTLADDLVGGAAEGRRRGGGRRSGGRGRGGHGGGSGRTRSPCSHEQGDGAASGVRPGTS